MRINTSQEILAAQIQALYRHTPMVLTVNIINSGPSGGGTRVVLEADEVVDLLWLRRHVDGRTRDWLGLLSEAPKGS